MNENRCRCPKCGAFEVIFKEKSADPFETSGQCLVCGKCGAVCASDSAVRAINRNNTNTFPSPALDLDIGDPMAERIKKKRR